MHYVLGTDLAWVQAVHGKVRGQRAREARTLQPPEWAEMEARLWASPGCGFEGRGNHNNMISWLISGWCSPLASHQFLLILLLCGLQICHVYIVPWSFTSLLTNALQAFPEMSSIASFPCLQLFSSRHTSYSLLASSCCPLPNKLQSCF